MSVVCLGGATVDRKYLTSAEVTYGTSNPVLARRNFGGVARNVGENLSRLGIPVALMSVVGNDENGDALLEHARRCGMRTHLGLRSAEHVTPEYAAVVNPDGELLLGLADMSAIESITRADLERSWHEIAKAQWLFVDCNLPADVLNWCIGKARSGEIRLAIDAVSEGQVCRLPEDLRGVDLFVLNEREAAAYLNERFDIFQTASHVRCTARIQERGARNVILTMGARGVLAAGAGEVHHVRAVAMHTLDTTGGSDALCAGVVYTLVRDGTLFEGARIGSLAAALTVESPATVRPDLSRTLLETHTGRLDEACTIL